MPKFCTIEKLQQFRKIDPRCDSEPKADYRALICWPHGPHTPAPTYAHATKERRGQQKERRSKKERGYVVTRVQEGSEHARGQRPGGLCVIYLLFEKKCCFSICFIFSIFIFSMFNVFLAFGVSHISVTPKTN